MRRSAPSARSGEPCRLGENSAFWRLTLFRRYSGLARNISLLTVTTWRSRFFRSEFDLVSVRQIEDLSNLEANQFFLELRKRGLICSSGAPQTLSELPRALQDLADDPFRSLIARLRRDCGCPKDHAPFAEFRWADFLRVHLKLDLHRSDPALAIKAAKKLIREAWCKDPCAECRCTKKRSHRSLGG